MYNKDDATLKKHMADIAKARTAGKKLAAAATAAQGKPRDIYDGVERVRVGGDTASRVKPNQLEKISKRQTKTP
jgi:hypothetical protein